MYTRSTFLNQQTVVYNKKMSKALKAQLTKFTQRKSLHVIYIEIIVGIILSIGSLLLFADIAEDVLRLETQAIDLSLSHYIYSFRSPDLNQVMFFATMLGAEFTLVIASVVAAGLAWKDHKREAILFILVLVIGVLLNNILKVIFQRPRPDFDPLMIMNSYSFPSGHSMNAFIFYSVLAYYVYHFTHKKLLGSIAIVIAVLLTLLVGVSRIYLGVHYPSDVLAGYIAGFFVFITAIVLEKTIAFRELVEKLKRKK